MKFFGKNVYVKRCGTLPTIGVSVSDRSIIASAAEDDSDAPKSGKCGALYFEKNSGYDLTFSGIRCII